MTQPTYRFGAFELNVRERQLRKHGSRIKLQRQPFLVLSRLLSCPNQVVSREELRAELWSEDTFVDFDHSLNEAVNKIRVVLGDSAAHPSFIETVPKHGYRFIAPVVGEPRGSDEAAVVPADASPSPRRGALFAVAAAIAALALLGLWLGRPTPSSPDVGPPRSLAVLPLDNLSGSPEQDYFAEGLTDELIAHLSKIEALRIISRTSARRYRGSTKSLREIGGELGVDALVEGSVRLASGRLRVTVHLVRSSTEESLWGKTFEGDASDVLAIQDQVARSIAREVLLELTDLDEARLETRGTTRPEAYQAYLKGRFYWNKRTEKDFLKAIEYFTEALSHEPRYAEAFTGLADTYSLLAVYNFQRPSRAMPLAKENAVQALALRPELAEAHASLGSILFLYDRDWTHAEAELRHALDLNPGYATTHQWLGTFLVSRNRMDEALTSLRRALELDPLSLSANEVYGWALYSARRYPEAIAQFEKTLELDPGFGQALRYLGLTYLYLGRREEALETLERAGKALPAGSEIQADLALANALAGRPDEAQRLLGELLEASETRYVSPYVIASFYTGLGDEEKALDWLERAYDERVSNVIFLGVDPFFDRLREAPRFRDLLEKIESAGASPSEPMASTGELR